MAGQGTRRTVLIAGSANLFVGVIKLAAGIMVGSSAMLAEAAHSAAGHRPGYRYTAQGYLARCTTWSTTPCSSRCCSCAPGAIVHRTGLTKLSEMGGLARRMPAVTAAFVIGAASIAGIPPLNGYASVSLIHSGLLDGDQDIPYVVMLAAQAITIAALGKAAWLASFRPRAKRHIELEPLRPGMLAGLGSLAGCCVVFGAFPQFFLRTVMASPRRCECCAPRTPAQ